MDKMIKIEAYFGLNINTDEGLVNITNEAFERFVQREIENRFDCFTIIDAVGNWKGTREPTKILEVQVAVGAEQYLAGHKVDEICQAYKSEFSQDCVLVNYITLKAMFI